MYRDGWSNQLVRLIDSVGLIARDKSKERWGRRKGDRKSKSERAIVFFGVPHHIALCVPPDLLSPFSFLF